MSRINSNVIAMRFRHRQVSRCFRFMAALTLVGWLGATTFCTLAGSGFLTAQSVGSAKAACAEARKCAKPCEGSKPSSSPLQPACPPGDNTCDVLKTALLGGPAAELIPPTLSVLYVLPLVALALDSQLDPATSAVFRQAQPRDWVFTLEVCLGPAFRSHAPPSLA